MDALEVMEQMNQRPGGGGGANRTVRRAVDFTGKVSNMSSSSASEDGGDHYHHHHRRTKKKDCENEGKDKDKDDHGHDNTVQTAHEAFDIEASNSYSEDQHNKAAATKDEEQEDDNVPQRFVITDLGAYQGSSLEERVESFTQSHPVVMMNKSWCLFSVDAQSFMMNTFKVSIHILELDTHPQGKAIHKHMIQKTGQKTVPVIFIKGEFLGGFEDVNAMYASGQLEKEYLIGLSHADRCENFLTKAHMTTKPLFWFPEKVNGHVIRISGVLSSFACIAAAGFIHVYTWAAYLTYGICFDYFLRLFMGTRFSPIGMAATAISSCMEPQMRVGRPKQFAAMCGLGFSLAGSIFYSVVFPYHKVVGSAFMGILAIATGMEGFLDFCLGCFIFKHLVQFGLIQK